MNSVSESISHCTSVWWADPWCRALNGTVTPGQVPLGTRLHLGKAAGHFSHPCLFHAVLQVSAERAEDPTFPQQSAFPKSLLLPCRSTVRGTKLVLLPELCFGSLPWEMNGLRRCHRCLSGNKAQPLEVEDHFVFWGIVCHGAAKPEAERCKRALPWGLQLFSPAVLLQLADGTTLSAMHWDIY